MIKPHPVIAKDLAFIVSQLRPEAHEFKNATFFITGGTGFIGKWLILSLLELNNHFDLNLQLVVLSRSPSKSIAEFPEIFTHHRVRFVEGDLVGFKLPAEIRNFDFLIHLAVESTKLQLPASDNEILYTHHSAGIKNLLQQMSRFKLKKILLTGSGAVYGFPTVNLKEVNEEQYSSQQPLKHDSSVSLYTAMKRFDEHAFTEYSQSNSLELSIARCFTFIGPYLDLKRSFAATQFLKCALEKKKIEILGTGEDTRSYMYAGDLSLWLLKMLLVSKQKVSTYNVGSQSSTTILDLANHFARATHQKVITLGSDTNTPTVYVPNSQKALADLNLMELTPLSESIAKTLQFYSSPSVGQKFVTNQKASMVVAKPYEQNKLFDLTDTILNRDNCLNPFVLLKEHLARAKIELHTHDVSPISSADYVIYHDMPRKMPDIDSSRKSILLLFESEVVRPDNWIKSNHKYFDKILTWNDKIIDLKKYHKFYFPTPEKKINFLSFKEKSKFCTLVAGNKSSSHKLELYSKRKEVIAWFEENVPEHFDYYGLGWDQIDSSNSVPLKILKKLGLLRLLPQKISRCYKGKIDSKIDTLKEYKFAICFENARDITGYVTEKITDCLLAGCIPIYWGAPNIGDHIDETCFIDYRKFDSTKAMYEYLYNMNEATYNKLLHNIEAFLTSGKYQALTENSFAQRVCDQIYE